MKKGQSMPLNVIIVAILVIVVLVVLVAVFTGRIALFNRDLGQQGQTDLISMRASYGDCRPTAVLEQGFMSALSSAPTDDLKAVARANFQRDIAKCANDVGCASSQCFNPTKG